MKKCPTNTDFPTPPEPNTTTLYSFIFNYSSGLFLAWTEFEIGQIYVNGIKIFARHNLIDLRANLLIRGTDRVTLCFCSGIENIQKG